MIILELNYMIGMIHIIIYKMKEATSVGRLDDLYGENSDGQG